jgi:pyrimidine deaminase RibD-like protein
MRPHPLGWNGSCLPAANQSNAFERKTIMLKPEQDLAFMKKALELSRQCEPEDDRVHPFVGAVIVTQNGQVISTGYRGQPIRGSDRRTTGDHAEQVALFGQRPDVLRGAIVYTTLEPCTLRGKEPSCCERLTKADVSEVVIGMLDPNRDIRGKGWWELEQRGIRVRYFDADIVQEIRRLNRDFIDYQFGVGLMITAIQAEGKPEIPVTADHRSKREVLELPNGKLTIRGSYRVKPTRGDRIVLLVRRGNRYMPQQAINFDHDRANGIWQAPAAYVWGKGTENELVIARISEDLEVAIQHYNTVHSVLKEEPKLDKIEFNRWIALIMNTEPPGFERLADLLVRATAPST